MNREHSLDDLEKYPVEGGDLPPIPDSSDEGHASWHIRLHACLQREPMVWRSQPEYPYLSVDAKALNRCYSTIGRTVLLTNEFLLQNLSRIELGRIMAAQNGRWRGICRHYTDIRLLAGRGSQPQCPLLLCLQPSSIHRINSVHGRGYLAPRPRRRTTLSVRCSGVT